MSVHSPPFDGGGGEREDRSCRKKNVESGLMGKKKRAIPIYIHDEKDNAEVDEEDDDLDLPLSEFLRGRFSRHHSSSQYVMHGVEGKVARNYRIETKKGLECTSPCSLDILPSGMSSKRRDGDFARPRRKMDNFTFDDHLEKIWNNLSGDRKSSFALLDSMCFIFYKTGRVSGLNRMRRKDIFSKKYVLIPIICWNHWRLVIFCHFGECVNSETRTRCILVLDSMEMGAREIEADLRKFVFDIFKAEVRPEIKDNIDRIPILVPKVPQQRNNIDCGRFVLYFIQNFMDAAPENFSLLNVNGYPYFMKPDWFTFDEFEDFCDNLEEESAFHPPLNAVVGRSSQRIRSRALQQQPPPRIGNKSAVSQESSKGEIEVIFIE